MTEPSPQEQARSEPWWVHLCRWLWRGLGFFWITIVFGLGINIASTRLTSHADFPADTPVGWVLGHLLLSSSVGGGLLLLTAFVGIVSSKNSVRSSASSTSFSAQQRAAIVRALQQEYNKRLEQSLQGAAMIALNLHERFDITQSSAQLVFSRTGLTHASPFPPGTSIIEVYDSIEGGFLILGAPGTGKTTLLLDLASRLLARTSSDPNHPIPVILNLSSWANKKSPLAPWLVDQLRLIYGVPYLLSRRLLEQDQWLLLLDGFDEVSPPARSRCIEAINAYRGDHLAPLVVCSRSREYLDQDARFRFSSAVEVRPLQEQEVTRYLKNLGKPMAAVRTTLRSSPTLRHLLTTPLMLNVVILAYREKTIKDLPQLGSIEEQQRQIFSQYVERMLQQHLMKSGFKPQQIYQRLIWLAQQMKGRSLTEFYLEQLQPDW